VCAVIDHVTVKGGDVSNVLFLKQSSEHIKTAFANSDLSVVECILGLLQFVKNLCAYFCAFYAQAYA